MYAKITSTWRLYSFGNSLYIFSGVVRTLQGRKLKFRTPLFHPKTLDLLLCLNDAAQYHFGEKAGITSNSLLNPFIPH